MQLLFNSHRGCLTNVICNNREALTSNELTINIQIDRLLKTLADPDSVAMGMGGGGQL